MTLIINGVDYSTYIQQKTDITETPRRISGNNTGTALDGTYIEDYVTTKYDPSFRAKPMPADKIAALLAACENEYVSIRYSSGRANGVRSIQAVPTASTIQFLTTYAETQAIYGGLVLSFTEK